MNRRAVELSFEEYGSSDELKEEDRHLIMQARLATSHAYAPYSHFHVGAAARLSNGAIVTGSNQENASFPAGICAERVLISACASQYPGISIQGIAVSYSQPGIVTDTPVAPCGICRQTLQELEHRFGHSIRLILSGMSGRAIVLEAAGDLLPLAFSKDDMK